MARPIEAYLVIQGSIFERLDAFVADENETEIGGGWEGTKDGLPSAPIERNPFQAPKHAREAEAFLDRENQSNQAGNRRNNHDGRPMWNLQFQFQLSKQSKSPEQLTGRSGRKL